ncbi:MAG: class I SAM-dependent methyltransferase [Deltaproteobacteria bacterium]|nr:class I SAM-dependent methyltransferase [Deltaproteobacteria bacterium]
MSFWADRVLPTLVEKACRSHAILAERQRWIPRAHGEVLEVGVGSGLNLAFYDPAKVDAVTGLDPSAALLTRAAARVATAPVPVSLLEGVAEQLPFPARAFDSAVITYSLCSVDDPQRALAELRRVLRPGGELIFVEHGLAPDARTRGWQRRLTPVWRRIGGGCRLDRDMRAILRDAGFRSDDLTAGFTEGASWLSYTFEGTARPA